MTSSLRCFGITTAAFLSLAPFLPSLVVAAQCPVYLTQWGTGGSGDGQFNSPVGVATDAAGNVYVADQSNNRIQKFSGTGTFLTNWGSLGSSNGQFMTPDGVATDSAGNVYVAEEGNQRIQKFTGTGTFVTKWGSLGGGDGQFSTPIAVATDAVGNVYVADYNNHRIQKFTSTGAYLTQWGSYGSGDAEFSAPIGVATDRAGAVYVLDKDNKRVQKFTNTGTYLTQWGSYGTGDGQFIDPEGVATDADGYVYVTDVFHSSVQKFTGTGTYLCHWGAGVGSGNGEFNYPLGVATDAGGNVFVVDSGNRRVEKFGPATTITHTITATAGPGGTITPSGAVQVDDGADQTFSITPDPGYQVAGVQVDTASVGRDSSYTFHDVVSDHTITASFEVSQVTHTITATAGPGGSIFPSGAVEVDDGVSITFFISPDPGLHVADVLVDSVSVGPLTLVTFTNVVSDHTIAATFAGTPPPPPPPSALALEANQIRMLVSAGGLFASDPSFAAGGLEFPKGSGKTVVFASGLWLGAVVNGSPRVTVSEYSDEFDPGAMVNGGPDDPGRPEYRVYRLDRQYASEAARDSALAEYSTGAVPHGAPTVSVLTNGELDIPGDQMLWHVYNDADPAGHTNRAGASEPLGVEVQQTAYAFNRSDALGNTVFVKFKVLNKGSNLLQDMYAALWSDPDLGGFADDLVGCDPTRSLGYCYNGTNNDQVYGSAPPAVGYDLLRAAKAGAPNSASRASSFIQYLNGGDPQNPTQSYNYLSGRLADGSDIINPLTNQPTSFFYTGDPVAGTGWLDTNPGDRRFLLPSGPFTLAPGETLEVVGAILIGDGTDRLSSIAKLRSFDDQVHQFFDNSGCQIAMSLTLIPRALSLRSPGRWLTGHLEPPAPWTAAQIDVPTIRLNGTVPVDSAAAVTIGDFNGNGIADLAVKFDRAAVELGLQEGAAVPVSVTGTVGGQCFSGADTIRVLRAVVSAPAAGTVLSAGTTTVRWEIPADVKIESVALASSFDDGVSWQLVARGLPNTGSYDWTAPDVLTDQARVAIVLAEFSDKTGHQVDGVLGVSGKFSIVRVARVASGEKGVFALRGVTPNPAQHELRVSFGLRDSKPATLTLFDVGGRRLAALRVDGMGPGWHTVTLGGPSNLSAGLYLIRLTQDGRSITTRAALVR